MRRFFGAVGYATTQKTAPGVSEDVIVEHEYYGDVLRVSRSLSDDTEVLPDVSVGNRISIVADEYANGHFFTIAYVQWMGVRWEVKEVTVESPRLILRLGGVYNGPTP